MNSSSILLVAIALVAALAIAGLFRPFLGMLIFITIHFVQPGELIPALEPLRIELFYGALLIAILFYRGAQGSGPSLLFDPIFWSAVVLLAAAFLSVPFAVWPGGAANTVIELMKLIALTLFLRVLVDSKARLRKILWCMAAVAAWFATSSLWAYAQGQFYAVNYDWGSLNRAQGVNSIVGGPNELAGLLLALFPLTIALLRCTRNLLAQVLLVAAGSVSLAAISLTGSRIAMIGLLAIAVYYVLGSKHQLLTCVACVILGLLIWTNLPAVYKERYLTVESYAQGGQLDASNELRLEIWRAGGRIFAHSPIVGVGAGQFSTAFGLMYLNGRHAAWMNPHNLLIQVACELGVLGLAAFCYFFREIVVGIRFVLRRKNNSGVALNYQTAIACSVMCVGVLILSLVGHTLYRPYWYLLAGLVAANRNIVYTRLAASEKRKREDSDRLPQDSDSVKPPLAAFSGEFEGELNGPVKVQVSSSRLFYCVECQITSEAYRGV
jgi:O-antigen ligase